MREAAIRVPLTIIQTTLIPDEKNPRARVEGTWRDVKFNIEGPRSSVDYILSVGGAPADPLSLIQRALSALGYVVGEHQKDVAQFSRWVDHLAAFPQTEEAKTIWTEAMLRLFGSDSPPLVPSTIAEASGACGAFVLEQMRLFPPTMKASVDDRPSFVIIGPLVESERTELREWRTSAKQRGWSTPMDLRGRTAADDAELAAWRDAAKANDFASPAEFASIKDWNFGQFVDRKVNRGWQLATQCDLPKDAENLRAAWHSETNCMFPREAGDKLRTLKSALKLQESRGDELVRDIGAWKKATGATDPANAVNVLAEQRDAIRLEWQEATGVMNPTAASKHIRDMKTQLLSYASEIDALRKAAQSTANGPTVVNIEHGANVTLNGQTIGHVYNPERELAKVRAELDSKRRECATEKERADKAELNTRAVAVIIDQVRNALGIVGADDSDLPQHVADLKRAYDALDSAKPSAEDIASETKAVATIIAAHIQDAGIESAANAICGRYASIANLDIWHSRVRSILSAKPGENIVDAARRTMNRVAESEKDAIAKDEQYVELRKLLHAKEGESAVDAAKRAIVPLEKPKEVAAGQRWAFVMTARPTKDQVVVFDFIDASGEGYLAGFDEIETGFFLGS